jgi:hypothetical protein
MKIREVQKLVGGTWEDSNGFKGLKIGDVIRFPDNFDPFFEIVPGHTTDARYVVATQPQINEGGYYECDLETQK